MSEDYLEGMRIARSGRMPETQDWANHDLMSGYNRQRALNAQQQTGFQFQPPPHQNRVQGGGGGGSGAPDTGAGAELLALLQILLGVFVLAPLRLLATGHDWLWRHGGWLVLPLAPAVATIWLGLQARAADNPLWPVSPATGLLIMALLPLGAGARIIQPRWFEALHDEECRLSLIDRPGRLTRLRLGRAGFLLTPGWRLLTAGSGLLGMTAGALMLGQVLADGPFTRLPGTGVLLTLLLAWLVLRRQTLLPRCATRRLTIGLATAAVLAGGMLQSMIAG